MNISIVDGSSCKCLPSDTNTIYLIIDGSCCVLKGVVGRSNVKLCYVKKDSGDSIESTIAHLMKQYQRCFIKLYGSEEYFNIVRYHNLLSGNCKHIIT